MKDRTYYGLFAGFIAGILQAILNLISYYFNFAQIRILDWMAIIIFGDKPMDSLQTVIALVARIFFAGMLGIVFAHLMKYLNDEHYLLKGWIYGILVMGLLYGVTSLLQVPQLIYTHTYTVISDFVTSSVFGLVLAESLKRLLRERV
ncbi:DUF6789 family protein [Desulfosporosinus lacus]|uniref:Uncharacterized protein n=1 Tax=Desulfosporosinus lacus DSM 15449 TaxID=1121420 RepID=A0A1M5QNS5_9FIRM|nr:DUF6789 family protein [Desulfosporosinus lacus]SHH15400.1 hypothetical protein SAMN02746098_00310 [Desulfosporosinus lacus DSM 15449]